MLIFFLFHNHNQHLAFFFLNDLKDAMPVSFRSELFTSYILTIFNH